MAKSTNGLGNQAPAFDPVESIRYSQLITHGLLILTVHNEMFELRYLELPTGSSHVGQAYNYIPVGDGDAPIQLN